MSRRQESEEDEYHESEDEDYNPEVDAAKSKSDSEDDEKPDESYAELQGTGGLIKTRAQRRAEAEAAAKAGPQSKKETAIVGTSGVDIDALWNEMNSAPPLAPPKPREPAKGTSTQTQTSNSTDSESSSRRGAPQEEYITITRTLKFAGDVKTETKRVLKSSAEGQDYLREQKAAETAKLKSQGRGPVKRKMSLMEEYQMNKTKKINTLEKSRLDWLGFVDKEGIREDLSKHNKSGYLDKQEFLSRAEQKAEQDLRQQRIKRMQQQQ